MSIFPIILIVCWVAMISPADLDPAVQAVVDRVSQKHYKKYQQDIESMGLGFYGGEDYDMGYRNRDYHPKNGPSPGNQEALLYIKDSFTAMGLNVSIQGDYLNVVGDLTGTKTPDRIYIIGGHYDHLKGDRPGGDDNASGTAGVLEAARVLSQYRFESTIRFICFNAEEDGLLGSKDYINSHVIPGGENILGMINMDMILRPGSDVDPDTVIDAELEAQFKHPPSVAWAKAYLQAAADYVPSLNVNDTVIHFDEFGTDHESFVVADFPAFLIIENSVPDFWASNSYYHTFDDASDRLANDPDSPSGVTFDYAFATDIIRTVVAFITQEALLVSKPSLQTNISKGGALCRE
jgi:Zn-dependent M28 family amino/carboxypeptidase